MLVGVKPVNSPEDAVSGSDPLSPSTDNQFMLSLLSDYIELIFGYIFRGQFRINVDQHPF